MKMMTWLLAASVCVAPSSSSSSSGGSPCMQAVVARAGTAGVECVAFAGIGQIPTSRSWTVQDRYPMSYLVSHPCTNVSQHAAAAANCTAFAAGDAAGSNAYALSGEPQGSSATCYALGHLGDALPPRLIDDAGDATKGVELEYAGGVAGTC